LFGCLLVADNALLVERVAGIHGPGEICYSALRIPKIRQRMISRSDQESEVAEGFVGGYFGLIG
jgi:hypothetical protein